MNRFASPGEVPALAAIRRWLTQLGVHTAHPLAFFIVAVYGLSWFVFERETFNWHAVATMATWFMTLFIQRAEYRDTQAIQAKLDELLHAQSQARDSLTHIDEEEPEDIARHREEARKQD
jgi:low affinity Fe/Cu permease